MASSTPHNRILNDKNKVDGESFTTLISASNSNLNGIHKITNTTTLSSTNNSTIATNIIKTESNSIEFTNSLTRPDIKAELSKSSSFSKSVSVDDYDHQQHQQHQQQNDHEVMTHSSSGSGEDRDIPFSSSNTRDSFLGGLQLEQRSNNDGEIETSLFYNSLSSDTSCSNSTALSYDHSSGSAGTTSSHLAANIDKIVHMKDQDPEPKSQPKHFHQQRNNSNSKNLNYIVPTSSPSPFEMAVWNMPNIVMLFLEFLGDPVAVCRMKMVNQFCHRIIDEREYFIMKNCVRIGGISVKQRPSFWMWVTLDKIDKSSSSDNEIQYSHANKSFASLDNDQDDDSGGDNDAFLNEVNNNRAKMRNLRNRSSTGLIELEKMGREGKWHHVIKRDVPRTFGNMPPHKMHKGKKTKSIVCALVTWGRNHLLRGSDAKKSNNNHEGTSVSQTSSTLNSSGKFVDKLYQSNSSVDDGDDNNNTDILSQSGSVSSETDIQLKSSSLSHSGYYDIVLSGNSLSNETKVELQKKLEFVLNVIAATHPQVGYCQGMDYVVAHVLRTIQRTVEDKASTGHLPSAIRSARKCMDPSSGLNVKDTVAVEESVFKLMNTLLTNYGLRHLYWPELRFLKTCCGVFERLVLLKLPVLADHFDHHDLSIGMFALGWFQTLFLYIPSMPCGTINHIWDIFIVERSMKIFFRVGIAILFLSQPILLNHDLEGIMQYLNTFPDNNVLMREILIPSALQIKITNKLLEKIEADVVRDHNLAQGLKYS